MALPSVLPYGKSPTNLANLNIRSLDMPSLQWIWLPSHHAWYHPALCPVEHFLLAILLNIDSLFTCPVSVHYLMADILSDLCP